MSADCWGTSSRSYCLVHRYITMKSCKQKWNHLFKQKFKVKKIEGKKRFPQFLLCMYVFLFVCLFVCRRSRDFIFQHRRLKLLHRYLYVNISKWYLLLFSIFHFFGVIPLFRFFTISCISCLRFNISWKSIHQIEA